MKKLLTIVLSFVSINAAIAQNSLDKAGLTSATPAATAYSLRLLSSSYSGAAIQVRRSSDNATLDIGFTASGDLDTLSLQAFTGGSNGFVNIWYDQSGNARNMVKADVNYQPQIVFNGGFKYIGSRVTIDFSGNKGLVYTGSLSLYSISTIIRSEFPYWPSYHAILDGSPRIGGILTNGGTNFYSDAPQLAIWKNGISKSNSESLSPVDEGMILSYSSQTYTLNQIFIGNYDGGGGGGSILESEAIAFASLISLSNRQILECNEGDYYSILTNCNTVINTQPAPLAAAECIGTTAPALSVQASGINLTYQWYSNSTPGNSGGTLINGATSSSIIPPTAALSTTYYYVEVSGGHGPMVTSNVSGAITVDALPTVSISPVNPTIYSGNSVLLTASGASSYLWGIDNTKPLDHASTYKVGVGLRLLRTGYNGPAFRLRRSSDNVESDFGFVGSELDVASVNTFLGASAGYCTILYDQSGFNNNLIQPNISQQPLLLISGLNGKPTLHFAAGQSMTNPTNFPPPYSVIYTARQTGPSRGRVLAGIYNNWLLGWWGGSYGQAYFDGWVSQPGGNSSNSNPYVYSAAGTGSSSSIYQNGILLNTNAGGLSGPYGITLNGSESSDADFAELFVFSSVLPDLVRNSIENSSGSYYGVFGAPPVAGPVLTVNPTITQTYTVTGSSANGGCHVLANTIVTVLNNPDLSRFLSQSKTYFDGSYTISAPASSSPGAFTYTSSNTAVATISGTTVNIIGAGVTIIKAVQAADSIYYSDSITATLTVSTVQVVTKNGEITTTNPGFVSKNGKTGGSTGLSINGEIKRTLSSGDGLTAESAAANAYEIKLNYPASPDGLYWISNPAINGGAPFRIYADMTTDGGGWTLILCNKSPNPGWDNNNALLRNQASPDINNTYSIIGWADYIKKSTAGFQYMIDAQSRRSNGGIWTANQPYSFVSTSNTSTDITLNTKFGSWIYEDAGIEERMPWYSPGSQGLITTSTDANGNWWGTLIASGGWDPAPWIGNGVSSPGVIWYWVR